MRREGNCVRPLLILALSCMMAARANSQVVTVVVTPVVWDTTDPRLASELRKALARAQPRLGVIAKDWTEAMFEIGSGTLSSSGLYEVGRILGADWVVGVHACPHPAPCLTVLISRVVWPLSPDTVTFHGAEWVRSATDTLSRRLSARRQEGRAPPTVPLIGDWQLNVGRTHYGPGVDRRRRELMTCTGETDSVRCVIRSVRADGHELTGWFSASLDGRTAPVTGVPDVDEVQLRRPSASLVDATFRSRGRPVFGYRAMRADDGRSLMVVAVDPVTRAAATTVVVYDRR